MSRTIDDYRRCAAGGMSIDEAAAALNVTRRAVQAIIGRYGIGFADAKPQSAHQPAIPGLTEAQTRNYHRIRPFVNSHLWALRAIGRGDLAVRG